MDITIKELLEGKPTLIKGKEFFPTKTYVEPFLERMSAFTDDFRVQVKLPDQMTMEKKDADITYNRVLIQAVLPKEHIIDGHDEVMGFLYGLDVRKPVVKIYRGHLNKACTNLCVFDPMWIESQELLPESPISFKAIKTLMDKDNDFAARLEAIKNTFISRDQKTDYLGKWVDNVLRETQDYGFGKVKLAVSTPIEAYKQLFINSESDYFIPEGINPSMFDVLNAFTQIITDDKKDLMSKFEKTIIINRLLDI